ncbi:MAG: hypothetical protein P0120_23745 [Nitrospira sp.]|nr:hypothetical protein [Nitrospira sp.]
MSSLSARSLLAVWERGASESPVVQALSLLAAAVPKTEISDLERLPIGRRDALLLTLREQLFGSRVQTVVVCPKCHDNLDLAFHVDQIRVPVECKSDEDRGECVSDVDDYRVTFRLPASEDLLAVMNEKEPTAAKQLLLKRCLLRVLHHDGETTTDLPNSVARGVIEQMALADPQGDVQLAVTCGVCGHQWEAIFDIVSFVWHEISAWTKRVLREVHILASAYGWAESDILGMSAWRRQCYLDMVQG